MATTATLKPEIVPRTYQTSIALSASRVNTLVILPTGLGKTLIAILVSDMRLKEFGGAGRILVLAPTKPLILQHKETFESSLLLDRSKFVLLTGETEIEDRRELWDDPSFQFVFATPETVQKKNSSIRCQRFVGQAKRNEEDKGMSQKLQKEILEKFRTTSEFNVLVSSSIGEEGLHVPDVDLVVFYEAVRNQGNTEERKNGKNDARQSRGAPSSGHSR